MVSGQPLISESLESRSRTLGLACFRVEAKLAQGVVPLCWVWNVVEQVGQPTDTPRLLFAGVSVGRVSLCSPGIITHRNPPASAFQVLRLKPRPSSPQAFLISPKMLCALACSKL
uniref:Uncharacterized protein n=1 Tax=Mus musculus TaxID=10090 RepID=Q8CBN6_MOUSE|nr:unnamed protein product [Mus musculus]